MSGVCFYCGVAMTKRAPKKYRTKPPTKETRDHVVPRSNGTIDISSMPLWWRQANIVKCCDACNCYKGFLTPIDWLVIMPSHDGARRLADLLETLGIEKHSIAAAMKRRAP